MIVLFPVSAQPLHCVDEQRLEGGIAVRVGGVAEGDADDAGLFVRHKPHARVRLAFVGGVLGEE
jgi:hypothetical protein